MSIGIKNKIKAKESKMKKIALVAAMEEELEKAFHSIEKYDDL